jgi:phosphoglycolate phosphatase
MALEIANNLNILPGEFLYLGDTDTDMKTANAAGMYSVGALWGFRTADELINAGAKTLIKNPMELMKLFN